MRWPMSSTTSSAERRPVSADDLHLARILWDWQAAEDGPAVADAALGLGSYDVRVADRCVELFNAGAVRLVCFTGGSGNFTRGRFPRGEAHAFAERALALGLPESSLVVEPTATNTAENITRSRPLLEPLGVGSLILVAKPNMLLRGQVTATANWPEVTTRRCGARVPFATDLAPGRSVSDLINELVGDAERLRLYPARGWHAPIMIPSEVAAAVRALIARGYDRHLPR
jgi:uncharacterized SAM-binding protein YcdF (DUF218 family)